MVYTFALQLFNVDVGFTDAAFCLDLPRRCTTAAVSCGSAAAMDRAFPEFPEVGVFT